MSFKEVHVAAAADVDVDVVITDCDDVVFCVVLVVNADGDDELVGDFNNSVLTPYKLPFLGDELRAKEGKMIFLVKLCIKMKVSSGMTT